MVHSWGSIPQHPTFYYFDFVWYFPVRENRKYIIGCMVHSWGSIPQHPTTNQ